MKYLRRALKYFIRMAFLVVVIIGVLMAAGLVSSDINIAFRDGWRSVGMIAAILGGISLLYPYFGYASRGLAVGGEFGELRGPILEYMEQKGYVLEKEEGENLVFRLSSVAGRISRLWEDRVTFTREIAGFQVEGLNRDIVRLVGGLSYKLKGNGNG